MNKDFNFLQLKKTEKGYEYAERKGKDSVAFVLFDTDTNSICLRNEYKPPVDVWIEGAFGGSMDKGKSPVGIVIDEVAEEAGFVIDENSIMYCGKYFVSTQMNQYCYIYVVDVTGAETCPKNEDTTEQLSNNHWYAFRPDDLFECWKAAATMKTLKEIFNVG